MTENNSVALLQDGKVNQARREAADRIDLGGAYQIKIEGHLDGGWSESLGGMEITHDEGGNTLLQGVIPDQSALHGVLAQVRDLGLVLVSLNPVNVGVDKVCLWSKE